MHAGRDREAIGLVGIEIAIGTRRNCADGHAVDLDGKGIDAGAPPATLRVAGVGGQETEGILAGLGKGDVLPGRGVALDHEHLRAVGGVGVAVDAAVRGESAFVEAVPGHEIPAALVSAAIAAAGDVAQADIGVLEAAAENQLVRLIRGGR